MLRFDVVARTAALCLLLLSAPGSVVAAAAAATPTGWYAPGEGVVPPGFVDLLQLISHGVALPTRTASWGALKQKYR